MPIDPAEIADQVRPAQALRITVVHLPARDRDEFPSHDIAFYADTPVYNLLDFDSVGNDSDPTRNGSLSTMRRRTVPMPSARDCPAAGARPKVRGDRCSGLTT